MKTSGLFCLSVLAAVIGVALCEDSRNDKRGDLDYDNSWEKEGDYDDKSRDYSETTTVEERDVNTSTEDHRIHETPHRQSRNQGDYNNRRVKYSGRVNSNDAARWSLSTTESPDYDFTTRSSSSTTKRRVASTTSETTTPKELKSTTSPNDVETSTAETSTEVYTVTTSASNKTSTEVQTTTSPAQNVTSTELPTSTRHVPEPHGRGFHFQFVSFIVGVFTPLIVVLIGWVVLKLIQIFRRRPARQTYEPIAESRHDTFTEETP